MAGLKAETFENYADIAAMLQTAGAGAWGNVGACFSLSAANPRTGAKNLRFDETASAGAAGINGVSNARQLFGSTKTTAGIEYAIYLPALPAIDGLVQTINAFHLATFLDQSGIPQLAFQLGTDGSILALDGQSMGSFTAQPTRVWARSQPCVFPKTYCQLGFKVVGVSAGGVFEVRVNNQTVLNMSGVDTNPSGAGEVSQVLIGPSRSQVVSLNTGPIDIDDWHTWDDAGGNGPADFVGNACCIRRRFTADTAEADWSKSTGSAGYALLDDASDATYIDDGATVGHKSAFTAEALPGTVAAIIYQQINNRGLKTVAGDCGLTPTFLSASAESAGVEQLFTTAEAQRAAVTADDPNTSTPWIVSGANAAKARFKRTT